MSEEQHSAPEPGVMHEVDEAFYKYTILQRDSAWREIERLKAERDHALAENTRLREACKDAPGILMSDEREQDAAEASYQKITRAIEENLLPELVRTSEKLSNLAKRARASDMRGVILSDAWIDGMAATMRHAHRRINEQSSTIDRLTAERDQALKQLEQLRVACDERGGVLLYLDTLAADFVLDGFEGAAREAAAFAEVIRNALGAGGQ